MEENKQALDRLYTLRAGLSAISQQYDKAQGIEVACDAKLSENAENFSRSLVCYDGKEYIGLGELQKRYGYVENIEEKMKSGEIEVSGDESRELAKENSAKAKKAFNCWLANDECNDYFQNVLKRADDYKRNTILSDLKDAIKDILSALLYFFFSLAALCGVIVAVALIKVWEVNFLDIIMCPVFGVGFIFFFVRGISSTRNAMYNKSYYKREIRKANKALTVAQRLVDNLPETKERARGILRERDAKIAPITKSCNEFYFALRKQFSVLLDERDWQHLDLVIFELETRRADSVKEALQLVDRELQTERIQHTIVKATEQICYEIRRGFAEMRATIIECSRAISTQLSVISRQLGEISGQLSELTDGVNLGNALQAKANVSSAQLISDVHAIRYYQHDIRYYQ